MPQQPSPGWGQSVISSWYSRLRASSMIVAACSTWRGADLGHLAGGQRDLPQQAEEPAEPPRLALRPRRPAGLLDPPLGLFAAGVGDLVDPLAVALAAHDRPSSSSS